MAGHNKILLAMVGADVLFLATGAAQLGFALIVRKTMTETPVEGEQAARNLLYQRFPLEASIVNAIMIFVAFAVTVIGILTPTRGWLKISGFLVTACATFAMCLGVYLWVLTLRTKSDFAQIWWEQAPEVQNLMQSSFSCCGYFNSTSPAFVTNDLCTSPAAAALQRGCASAITTFSNTLIDDIFTAVFGMVGVDVILIMGITCVLKDRKERERYRHIDEKTGYRGI